MNFITTNLNEKFLNVRKIYCLKLFIFFIKDPDPDLYVGDGSEQKSSGSATLILNKKNYIWIRIHMEHDLDPDLHVLYRYAVSKHSFQE